jgi:hypothetical protein
MTPEIKEKREEQRELMLNAMSNKIPDDSNAYNDINTGAFNPYMGSVLFRG